MQKLRKTKSIIGVGGHFACEREYAFETGEFGQRGQIELEVDLFEGASSATPDDTALLKILAEHYTRLGNFKRGLEIDFRLAELQPNDPVVRYNLACSLALVAEPEKAIRELHAAIRHGYRDWRHMQADHDLDNLRSDPRFGQMLEKMRNGEDRSPKIC